MSQLDVLFLIDEIKVKGGSENHLLELVEGLSKEGFRLSVMTLADGEFAGAFRALPGVEYRCLNVRRIYGPDGIRAFFELRDYLARRRVAVLHTFHTGSDLLGPLIARSTPGKVAVVSSRRDMGYTKSARHVACQRVVNGLVDVVLANSHAVKMSVHRQERVPLEKIRVIHNGIHAGRLTGQPGIADPQLVRRFGIEPGKFYVGSVGNVRAIKGYRLMVELAARLCPRHPQLRFLHAGEGEEKAPLEQLCRELGLEEKFTFLGSIREIPQFLSVLDLYLQPSLSEGFSNAILEAMAAGLPVIATKVGGNPEVIEDGVNGSLAPPGDVAALESKLEALLLDDDVRSSLAIAGQKTVLSSFTFQTMMEMYLQFYRSLGK